MSSAVPTSPWRQPVFWLVLALPAAVVVAGISMLMVASQDGRSDAVVDNVHRVAQIQTADLAPDLAARDAQLSVSVRVNTQLGTIEVLPIRGAFDRAAPLQLLLSHPVSSSADRILSLAPGEHGWSALASIDRSHDWLLQLGPADARWRLRGRWLRGEQTATLRAAW